MNWQLIVIAAICAVLWGSYSMFNKHDDDTTQAVSNTPSPGYYMKNAAIVETGADGNPRLQLHAENIEQDVAEQRVELQGIALNYLSNTGTPWQLTAQRGSLEQDTRIVTFSGDVQLSPQGSRITTPVTLHTDQLSVDTESNIAVAPGPVSILMNDQTVTAIGLRADMQRQTVKLMSQVHGEFTSH